jgi:acetate---CoA ligase (ADP-forming)
MSDADGDALATLFAPRGVAIIGATDRAGTMPAAPTMNLLRHGYKGRVFPVNPRRSEVFGHRCFGSVRDLSGLGVETAVVVLPAPAVLDALRECHKVGVKTATVFASGFGEAASASEGRSRAIALRDFLNQSGMRLLGPNTAGLVNLWDSYVPRGLTNHHDELRSGSLAVVTQSGAMSNIILNRAAAAGVGVGCIVAAGTQLDLNVWDLTAYLLSRPESRSVALAIEGFSDAGQFIDVARAARERRKPLILMKLGVTPAGIRAVQTHSGAMAGTAAVQRAVLDELGVIAVDDLDMLWEVGSLVDRWGCPDSPITRIGAIALSGGDGAIIADECGRFGLDCPEFAPPTQAAIRETFTLASAQNPFDPGGEGFEPPLLHSAVQAIAKDPDVDALLIALPVLADIYSAPLVPSIVAGLDAASNPRIALSAWDAGELTSRTIERLRATGLPLFGSSPRAIRAIAKYSSYLPRPGGKRPDLAPAAFPSGSARAEVLPYWASRRILASAGVVFNSATEVNSLEAAVSAAAMIGYPVTVKASTSSASHKARHGAVELFIRDADELRARIAPMAARFGVGRSESDSKLVVERYIPGIQALVVGGSRDPEFGPMLVFGSGGGATELIGDVALARCPLDEQAACALIGRTGAGASLHSESGLREQLVGLLVRASKFFADSPEIEAFDLNPLLITPDSEVVAVDARVEVSVREPGRLQQ